MSSISTLKRHTNSHTEALFRLYANIVVGTPMMKNERAGFIRITKHQ